MEKASIIGVDLAKNVLQAHGAGPDGQVIYRKKLTRSRFMKFITGHPTCVVVMETCATAHNWRSEFLKLGHEVRLIPPIYVKPFVKRQKNDTNDAEAITEAATRPTMYYPAGDACIAERAVCAS